MDDCFLAAADLAAQISSAGPASGWDWDRNLSDHAPLVATLSDPL